MKSIRSLFPPVQTIRPLSTHLPAVQRKGNVIESLRILVIAGIKQPGPVANGIAQERPDDEQEEAEVTET